MSRQKQLQRLKPAEDEKKLQTKQFVELVEAARRKQGQMIVDINEWSRLKSRDHFLLWKYTACKQITKRISEMLSRWPFKSKISRIAKRQF